MVFGALLICGLGLPLPEDVVLIAGGFLAFLGTRNATGGVGSLPLMILIGLAGILAGDSMIYAFGSRSVRGLSASKLISRLVTPEGLERARGLFEKHGEKIVMIARFVPGLRAVMYFTAGASRMQFWRFLLFDGVAACVSAPVWVIVGFKFGEHRDVAMDYARRVQGTILVVALVAAAIFALVRWRQQVRRAARESEAATSPAKRTGTPLVVAVALLGAAYATHRILVRRPPLAAGRAAAPAPVHR